MNNEEDIILEKDDIINETQETKIVDESQKTKDKEKIDDKEVKEINFEQKYLTSLADMENLRKRLSLDKIDFIKYKASSFIYDILPTIDMFENALSAKDVSEETKSWLLGFKMILTNLKESLKNEGVKEIIIKIGDEFNGNLHQSFDEVKTDEVKPGHIFKVNQKGYTIHDRLLRPAMVEVAEKGE